MANIIIEVFWLFLPAGIANMAPVLFTWLPFLAKPMDSGKKIGGKRILGKNKTWRGFIVGIAVAVFIVWLQKIVYPSTQGLAILNYQTINIWVIGLLLGVGALLGDLVESFLKRQRNIPSGKPWIPFDQLDWIIGAIIFVSFAVDLTWQQVVVALVLFGLLHPLINLIGYALRVKKNVF